MVRKVAIITRTKNRNIFLRRALQSVVQQEFKDWVWVIVNDGGEIQEIEDLIAKNEDRLQNRVMLMHNEQSQGMEAASNKGIQNSESDYVIIHDDDRFPSVAGVITHSKRILETIDNEGIKVEYTEPYNTWLQSVSIYRMAASNVFSPISFLYKRSVYDTIGYYREDLPVLGDWEFNLRFVQEYDIILIPEILANYHHRLKTSQGDLGNSVIKDDYWHKFYDSMIRNELLRQDLRKNTLSMGYLVNLVQSFETLHAQIAPFENTLRRLRQSMTFHPLKRLLKRIVNK